MPRLHIPASPLLCPRLCRESLIKSSNSTVLTARGLSRTARIHSYFGVFTPESIKWQLSDAIGMPLAWIAYTPFLTWVLLRDSHYWSRCGFTACLMGDAAAGASAAPPHRVPLLAMRASSSAGGYAP